MDLNNKTIIIGVNYRDLERDPASQHIFAEIVLIDKSNDVLHPLLYQLRKDPLEHHDDISTIRHHGFTGFESNAFAMIGEVISLNKSKKQIYLQNEITVTYQHLVLASGLQQSMLGATHDEELSAGLHALMEAIRVRDNISNVLKIAASRHLGFQRKKPAGAPHIKPEPSLSFQDIEKILIPHTLVKSNKSLDMVLAGTDKRLYEFQL